MDNLWDTASQMRAAVMRDGLEFTSTRGLEIGPLANPILLKGESDVSYVDHTDTASLRKTYEASGFADRIVEVDAVWGEQSLLSCIGGQRVDYIMASHVAEHVPDLVTWLAEAGDALLPGGQLRLALPDLRFSNDVLRPPTRISDLLTAWLLKARRPQLRDVLDFRLHETLEVDGAGFYYGRASRDDVRPIRPAAIALDAARMVLAQPDNYFDVHCLAASALQFASLMVQLAEAGLLTMACARMIDTAPPLFEFYVFLTPSDDKDAIRRSWTDARAACQDPLPGSAEAQAAAARAAEMAWTAAELTRTTGRLQSSETEAVALATELAGARGELSSATAELSGLKAVSAAQAADALRITSGLAQAIALRDADAVRMAATLATLSERLAQSERHVTALHGTQSWRLTAPLRMLKRLVTPSAA